MGRALLVWFVAVAPWALGAQKPYFIETRHDAQVPTHCAPATFEHFSELPLPNPPTVMVSIDGALKKGFTHEYPMARDEATVMWKFFKGEFQANATTLGAARRGEGACAFKSALCDNFELAHRAANGFDRLKDHYLKMEEPAIQGGFEFINEGDVLETLIPHGKDKDGVALNETYPPADYFITGGWEYHSETGATVGELDVIVGNKTTCKVVAIGEAKLGLRSLTKAKEQLARFINFLTKVRATP